MHKLLLKQLVRRPIKLVTLILTLSLSGVILCLGVTLFVSARQSTTQADKSFTTIAVPNFTALIKASGLYDATRLNPVTSEEWSNYNAARTSFIDLYEQLVGKAAKYEGIKNVSLKAYMGYSPHFTPLTARSANPKEINPHLLDQPYNYAIFLVTCFKFEDPENTDANGNPVIYKNSKLVWKVDEIVSLHPGYNKPEYMRSVQSTITYLSNDKLTHTLADYFDVGKQYIVLGKFTDNRIISKPKEIDGVIDPKDMEYIEDFASLPLFDIFDARPIVSEQGGLRREENGMFKADSLPYAEVTEDLDRFLSSDNGSSWKTIIDNVDSILHSAYVVPTNNIQSILSFNQNKSNIVDGRHITQNEYNSGSNVCIINKKFAEYNDLQIGDSIPLSLHAVYHHINSMDFLGNIPTWYHNVYPYELELTDPKEYKIVGIYQSQEWSATPYSLSPNTIFIPVNSIENPPIFSKGVQLLFSSGLLNSGTVLGHPTSAIITIPNDKIEETKRQLANETYNDYNFTHPISKQTVFENKIIKEDLADFFVFYDQGYSTVSLTIKTMNLYSVVILVFCILVWCATLCFFVYIFIFRQKQELGILRSLGLTRKKTLLQLFIHCVIIAFISIVITGTTVMISADHFINQVYSILQEKHPIDQAFSDVSIGTANQGTNSFSGEVDTTVKAGESFKPVISYSAIYLVLGLQTLIFLVVIVFTSMSILDKKPLQLLQSREF